MNHNHTHRRILAVCIAALALLSSIPLSLAQQTTQAAKSPRQPGGTEEKAEAVTTLSAFEVTDSRGAGYLAKNAISGSKTAQPLEDLAGAYSVVTRDVLNDLGTLQNMPEGIRFVVPGITPFVRGDQYMIRGRRSGGTTDDGVPSVIFFADSVGVDSIEVMKGPQAVLYGQQAGIFGNILRVSKKPLPVFRGTATAYWGSDNFKRAEIDVTGPLAHGFSYRLIGAWQHADTFLKNGIDHRKIAIGTLQWKGATTTARVRFERQNLRQRGDTIQIGSNEAVFNLFTGAGRDEGFFPEWGKYEDTGNLLRINVIQEFGEHLQSRLNLSRAITFRDYIHLLAPVVDWSKGTFTQDYFNYAEDFRARGLHLDNIAKFEVKGVVLQTNFGYGLERTTPQNFTRSYITKFISGNVFAPKYANLLEPRTSEGATGIVKGSQPTATSIYLLETAQFFQGRLILNVGAAYNKSVVKSQVTGATTTNQGDVVRRFGAVYKPVKNISLYYGYATMFNPSAVTIIDINGNPMPIITGIGQEIGVKARFLDDRLSVAVDYYKLERTNISVFTGKTNSRGLGYYELVGDELSQGWEFEVKGSLSRNWELIAVAWNGESLDRFGAPFFNSLKKSMGMFTHYRFDSSGPLAGLAIGGGSYTQGQRYFGATGAIKGYNTHTVFANYSYKTLNFRLNVENLTDEIYLTGAWSKGQVSGGAPRSFRLSVENRF